MNSQQIDWSTLPGSNVGDRFWYKMVAGDAVARLHRLHAAIDKWRAMTDEEFYAFRRQVDAARQPSWDEYDYDPARDEAFMLLETERALCANLGVTIASAAEAFIRYANHGRRAARDAGGKADLGVICQNLSTTIGVDICTLAGYADNQRARLLGNCFKHHDGRTDERFAAKYQTAVGLIIEFEQEDWKRMIDGTGTLLDGIAGRL